MSNLRVCSLGVLLKVILLCTAGASAQEPSGSLSGYVTCNDGNVPARGARVELVPLEGLLAEEKGASGAAYALTTTDFAGVYEIPSVPPGAYVIRIALDGYSDDFELIHAYLDRFSADDKKKLLASLPTINIKAGSASRKDLLIRRAASIAGRITVDLGGTPGKVAVTAILVATPDSTATTSASPGLSRSAIVDDRGDYRITGLPPGSYRVSVRITENFLSAHVTPGEHVTVTPVATRPGTAELLVFAPDSLNESSARLIKVGDGDEITDAGVSVPTRLLHSIGGTVTEDGSPLGGIGISLQRPDGSTQFGDAVSDPDGIYRFDLLPAGAYTLTARRTNSPQPGSSAPTAKVTVQLSDNDVLDANIDLRPPQTH